MFSASQDVVASSGIDPLNNPWLTSGDESGDQETGEDTGPKTGLEDDIDDEDTPTPKT